MWKAALQRNPPLRRQHEKTERTLLEHRKQTQHLAKAFPPPYVLPVVVHIIHDNGTENISDATAIQGIQDLNDAFANVGYYDPATGVDTRIQFCLARRDPTGNLTTGITRNQSALTDMLLDVDDIAVKDLNRWDPTQYINIWLVREICQSGGGCGVAGYAYLPTSHGNPEDGIVMEAGYFGSSQGASGVQIHEMGHYLGLYHTFQGGCTNNDCLADGDRVCDTPPDQSTAAAPCGTPVNSCSTDTDSGFATDQNDLIEDYMDYGDFDCWSVFTQGQTDRMYWHIENVRFSLLESKACLNPCTVPIVAAFSPGAATVNTGTTINFVHSSTNATHFNWTLDGFPFSTAPNPNHTFNTEGTYEVCLEVGNADPNCYDRRCDTIEVVCPVTSGFIMSTNLLTPGQSATFTNTSANATNYTWIVNGSTVGSTTDLAFTFPGSGFQTICLTADNGICEATSCQYLFSIYISGSGECDTSYLKTYGSPVNDERGNALIEIPLSLGGGFLIGGGKGDSAMITRLDLNANIVWTRAFDPTPDAADFIWSLNFDSDNNVIGSGQTRDEPDGNVECFVFKYNIPTNNILWVNELDLIDPAAEIYRTIFEKSPGGNYVVTGDVDQNPGLANTNSNGFILEVNRNTGANVWQRSFTLGNAESFQKSLLHNGAIYTTGRYNFDPNGTARWRPGITKLNLTGVQQWSRLYLRPVTNTTVARLSSADMVADNGLVVLGHGDLDGTSTTNVSVFLYKTDDEGNLLWAMEYDIPGATSEVSTQLISVPDGYVCLGYYIAGSQDVFVFKTDKQGQLLWSKSYGNASTEDAFDLIHANGQIYFTGKTRTPNPGATFDLFFANIADDGAVPSFDSCNLFTDLNITALAITDPYSGQHNLTPLSQNWGQFLTDKQVGTTFLQSTTVCLQACLDSCSVMPNARLMAAQASCYGDSMQVSLQACNPGILDLPAGTPVSFYLGDPTSTNTAVLVATLPLPYPLPYDSCATFSFILEAQPQNTLLFVMLNDDGTTPLPFSLTDFDAETAECDYTNNIGNFLYAFTPPNLDLGPDLFMCQNGVTVLDAGPGFAGYQWQDGSTEPTLTAFGPGIYSVTATDACGGVHTDQVQVTVDSSTVLDLGPDLVVCEGSSISFQIPGYVSYQWSPTDFLSCADCPDPTVLPASDIRYTLVATTANGCVGVSSVQVTVASSSASFTETELCTGDTLLLFGGTPVTSGGTYQHTFVAHNGCDSVATVVVEALASSFQTFEFKVCSADSTILFGGQTFLPGDTVIFNYQNIAGCDSVIVVVVTLLVPPPPTFVEAGVCPGDSLMYLSEALYPGDDRTFLFMAQNGCDSVVHISVAAYPAIVFDLSSEMICPNLPEGRIELHITAGEPPLTSALDGGAFSGAGDFEGLFAGEHTVLVKDTYGCQAAQSITIPAFPPLVVATEDYVLPCAEPFVTLQPTVVSHKGPVTWAWPGGWNKAWFQTEQAGVFTVQISDDCDTQERSIQVDWGDDVPASLFYVPNVFSPNDDGKNEEFRVFPAKEVEVLAFELSVFDRWGNQLFLTSDFEAGWNGIFGGEKMDPAVMVWYVKASVAICGRVLEVLLEGDVTLVR